MPVAGRQSGALRRRRGACGLQVRLEDIHLDCAAQLERIMRYLQMRIDEPALQRIKCARARACARACRLPPAATIIVMV